MFKIDEVKLWDRHNLQVEGEYDASCSCGWYKKPSSNEHPVTHILKDMVRETLKELL